MGIWPQILAAEVIANEMQLDLYKIDLSRVVSKYIGETEKNLAALFNEAKKCNAILFFDEADALFTKRTNVADAHDRYANMETSFLLQLIEEYDGAAILSSNFKQNIDQAFLRRLKCIVDFPFPNKTSRLRIWRNSHPKEAPLSTDIDFELLAANYTLSGGNIRNILLNGAFLAAHEEKEISMSHLMRATKREYEKIGKNWPGDFS
jgi:SpoVK/Ycf46/Vps4 family AAA+-type ATPase